MKLYQVYQRGTKYRLARPGWFLWHWLRVDSFSGKREFWESGLYYEARERQLYENKSVVEQYAYRQDHWKQVK